MYKINNIRMDVSFFKYQHKFLFFKLHKHTMRVSKVIQLFTSPIFIEWKVHWKTYLKRFNIGK